MASALEQQFVRQVTAAGLPAPVPEFQFHATRKWRADFAWPEAMVFVEIDGGTWTQGRHSRGKGYAEDCVKLNEAALLGYTVIRVTGEHITSGAALEWVSRALSAFYDG